MDSSYQENEKENSERRNSNTEYLPTKCRITRPPPPKPATNPLQFIKVAPPPLFQKAQEQIKKVEEIRSIRQELKDDGEDWQQNLDNWKSSRRKRQEHIIERVVEVKKLTQEEQEKSRRKSKTFNEILEERSKRGHRLKLPIYEDDDNDFSSYGIGSGSLKASEPEKNLKRDISNTIDSKSQNNINKESSVESQSEDKTEKSTNQNFSINTSIGNIRKTSNINKSIFSDENVESKVWLSTYTQNLYANKPKGTSKPFLLDSKIYNNNDSGSNNNNHENNDSKLDSTQQYTYESAIEGYRTRIRSKINVDESIFNKPLEHNKPASDVDVLIPKGALYKRKEIFETEKPVEVCHLESSTSRRLSEDFVKSQSIKERLKSLEKCTDQPLTSIEINSKVKASLLGKSNSNSSIETKVNNNNNKLSKFNNHKDENDRCSSPEAEMYMNKLNMFNKDLDALLEKTNRGLDNEVGYYCGNINYPPSSASGDLVGLSSDREDSGIHTADVSCSVSQADESAEDNDLFSSAIPGCIEKLNREKERCELEQLNNKLESDEIVEDRVTETKGSEEMDKNAENLKIKEDKESFKDYRQFKTGSLDEIIADEYKIKDTTDIEETENDNHSVNSTSACYKKNVFDHNSHSIIIDTRIFLDKLREDSIVEFNLEKEWQKANANKLEKVIEKVEPAKGTEKSIMSDYSVPKSNGPAIYENIDLKPNATFLMECVGSEFSTFPLAPPKAVEPPKEKPPPPPPLEQEVYHEKSKEAHIKRLNSTKRIKKEIHVKRSSFLGLDEPTEDQIDPDDIIERPPDINSFLQKESQLEKSLYRKLHGSRDGISEVESQDSGLESERGRLSSDTWCSNGTPTHTRQDSGHTNSVTSEEDEITKKEREIIEMVEKEEKSRNSIAYPKDSSLSNLSSNNSPTFHSHTYSSDMNLQDKYHSSYSTNSENYSLMLSDTDSEVLKVEQELRQLEQEELERRKESMLFREARAKIRNQNNRHSLENICDLDVYPTQPENNNYRKSLPDIPHDLGLPIQCCKSVSNLPTLQYRSELIHRKSVPDIQQMYGRSKVERENLMPIPSEHRKSMPELQDDFRTPPVIINHSFSKQGPVPTTKLTKYSNDQRTQDKLMLLDYVESEAVHSPSNSDKKQTRPLSRHGLHVLSAAPKPKHIPNDNWIQPKLNPEVKSYNQHWLFQEAELRRIQDQEKNGNIQNRQNWQWPSRQEKHIPEPIIQTLTQRIQSRTSQNDRHQPLRRLQPTSNKDYPHHPYVTHPHNLRHGVPISYSSPAPLEESQSKLLSVSGKKKCSFCGNELGRGAAMIIESLCLFYHMECFKCCVCHVQLGDGRMGTDVRVRNQKLHCHNCYSSDDGVKFSCV